MDLEGFIYKVMEPNSGISQKTGNPWMSQEFVLGYFWFPNQTMPSYMVFRVFGEDRIKQFDLHENDEVKIRFNVEAHESNGRWFNEIRCSACEKKHAAAPASSGYEPKGILGQKAQEEAARQAAATPAPEPQPEKDPKDDLPF